MMGPTEHLREGGYGFDLHGRAGAAAVEGVVVGIDRHCERIGGAGDGVGRLQHLAGVERVGVGVVVLEADGGLLEDVRRFLAERRCGAGREMSEALVQSFLGIGEKLQEIVGHNGHRLAANGLEAELHPETNGGCENKSGYGPWAVRDDALSENLDEKDQQEENYHQNKAVGDEDARRARRSEQHVLHVKGRDKRSDKKDKQEENKLQRRKEGLFHK
jgi:hypothetical protein